MIDVNRRQPKPFVVSICGPSNAGKSQLAKATARILGEHVASRVPVDYFFVPRLKEMTPEKFLAQPMQWDWPLLASRLALPGGTRTSTPDVDFDTFQRRKDDGGLPLVIRPVMICDAMEAYPYSDLVVLLDVPEDVRRKRIVDRDLRWGTVVADRWWHLEETWRKASEGMIADIVLYGIRVNGSGSVGANSAAAADVRPIGAAGVDNRHWLQASPTHHPDSVLDRIAPLNVTAVDLGHTIRMSLGATEVTDNQDKEIS